MRMRVEIDGERFEVDLSKPHDLSIAVDPHGPQRVRAFGLAAARSVPARSGTFVGDVRLGGSCNCEELAFSPHGSGTHTEGRGHISSERIAVRAPSPSLLPATLVTVTPRGKIIDAALLQDCRIAAPFQEALVIRTLPNPAEKRQRDWSGTNPAHLVSDAMEYLASLGVQHLVLDLPSADPEDDGGKLLAHRAFLRGDCTITELAFIDDAIVDGAYLLDLQVAPIALDAAPSRPILYEVTRAR